ncbi:MAG TPA: FCD domain-containing protein [Clostridia bacterium]|nr:FCD domain-containing protein [Clostridia bacterium]
MLKKDTIPNLIIEQIKNKIKSGEIKPGDKLPNKNEMAEMFNVGKNSIRETLAALEYLEIIKKNKDGYMINENLYEFHNKSLKLYSKLEKDKMKDLFEVRKIIECKSIELAINRLTKEAKNNIEKYLKECEKYSSIPDKYISVNQNFHLEIIKAANNKLLLTVYKKISNLLFLENDIKNLEEIISKSLKYHRKIFTHMNNDNTELAKQTLLEHLNHVYNESKL